MSTASKSDLAVPDTGTPGRPDVPALMEEIRRRMTAVLEGERDGGAPILRYPADQNGHAPRKAGELVNSEELRFLNRNFTYGADVLNPARVRSHRGGIVGRVVEKAKRIVLRTAGQLLLRDYLEKEREFHAHVVRYLNDVAKYVDARDASNFWELIRKLDVDIGRVMERLDQVTDETHAGVYSSERRLNADLQAAVQDINKGLGSVAAKLGSVAETVRTHEGIVTGLESIVHRIGHKPESAPAPAHAGTSMPDYTYVLLENRFRGGEAQLTERLRWYVDLFDGAPGPILEIGGGRGELQRLFKERGLQSYSVDVDAAMVEHASASGVDARHGDGIAHLEGLENRSLGGIVAVQVIEHLPFAVIERLLHAAREKLRPGGRIALETINPRSVLALSSNYFRDPTHVAPLHPDTMRHALSLAGFKDVTVHDLSPVPREAQLPELKPRAALSPQWTEIVESLNATIERLNGILYGFQDYCISGVIA